MANDYRDLYSTLPSVVTPITSYLTKLIDMVSSSSSLETEASLLSSLISGSRFSLFEVHIADLVLPFVVAFFSYVVRSFTD